MLIREHDQPDKSDDLADAFRGARTVVTGAAGFIGSHLCEHLIACGAQVLGIDSFLTGQHENLAALEHEDRFKLVAADVTEPYGLAGPVDYVFHLASPASPTAYLQAPVTTLVTGSVGTLNWLTIAAKKKARFLLASTSEVYGDPQVHPQREDYWGHVNPVGPRSVYDEAKRYAEALTTAFASQESVSTGIARIFNTYGPRMRPDDGRVIPTFVEQSLSDRPLTVTGEGTQTRSLCYVEDTVAGLLALAASDLRGPVNIGNPHEITILELANEVRRLCSSQAPVTFVPLPVDDPKRRCPDITLATTALGWTPRVELRSGLSRTVQAAFASRQAATAIGGAA